MPPLERRLVFRIEAGMGGHGRDGDLELLRRFLAGQPWLAVPAPQGLVTVHA
jgi:hypothetical protein